MYHIYLTEKTVTQTVIGEVGVKACSSSSSGGGGASKEKVTSTATTEGDDDDDANSLAGEAGGGKKNSSGGNKKDQTQGCDDTVKVMKSPSSSTTDSLRKSKTAAVSAVRLPDTPSPTCSQRSTSSFGSLGVSSSPRSHHPIGCVVGSSPTGSQRSTSSLTSSTPPRSHRRKGCLVGSSPTESPRSSGSISVHSPTGTKRPMTGLTVTPSPTESQTSLSSVKAQSSPRCHRPSGSIVSPSSSGSQRTLDSSSGSRSCGQTSSNTQHCSSTSPSGAGVRVTAGNTKGLTGSPQGSSGSNSSSSSLNRGRGRGHKTTAGVGLFRSSGAQVTHMSQVMYNILCVFFTLSKFLSLMKDNHIHDNQIVLHFEASFTSFVFVLLVCYVAFYSL